MKIKTVMKETKLTRKAIEYYLEQDLIKPNILENGYREFNDCDVIVLKKVATYRKLGLGINEIKQILLNPSKLALIYHKKQIALENQEQRLKLFKKLLEGKDISEEIDCLEAKQTIIERLLDIFPNHFGRFLAISFGPYLNEIITTDIQAQAFVEITTFLDNCPTINIPDSLQQYLDEQASYFTTGMMNQVVKEKEANIVNYDEFIENNQEILEAYMAYKKSDEYLNSPVYQLNLLIRQFCQNSGYYDVFIPALRRLSKAYDDYYRTLLEANEKFVKQYPEVNDI